MYCGACARDIALVRGLIERGHDVEVVPLYTPLRFDGPEPIATTPVMLGGINAYLEQYLPFWRWAPAWLRKPLDSPSVLSFATRFAVSTEASDLGPMIVSVLRGMEGKQRRSLCEVIRYVVETAKPDLVSVTNSLLTGVAPELKRLSGVPIVSALQGEDSFLDAAPEPHRSQARQVLRENARSVDLFISPSEAYASTMAEYLDVAPERIRVVRTGIDPGPYRRSGRNRPYPFTIGYLSVITPAKGLDILIDTVLNLLKKGEKLELVIAGRVLDRAYWKDIVGRIDAAEQTSHVRYLGEVDFNDKVRFYKGCSVVCLPTRIAEARGVVALEAQASGVPVVVPDRGIFPEMLSLTGGGLLYPAGDTEALEAMLTDLIRNPERAIALGDAGAEGVPRHFSADQMVEGTLAVFEDALKARQAAV